MNKKDKNIKRPKITWNDAIVRYKCQYCHDTRLCMICGGAGCMTCNYEGICRHCRARPEER